MDCSNDGNRAVFDRRKVLSFHPASTGIFAFRIKVMSRFSQGDLIIRHLLNASAKQNGKRHSRTHPLLSPAQQQSKGRSSID
jgi:hypothetical protein